MILIQRGTEILASGSTADAIVSRLEVNGSIIIEESECVRAEYIAIFERGNRRNAIAFSVGKLHDSQIAAEHHRLTHAQGIVGRADFVLQLTENGTLYTATIKDAGWRTVRVNRRGIWTDADYEVIGGKFTTTNAPAPNVDLIDGGLEGSGYAIDDDVDGGNAADSAGCFVEVISGGTPS